MGDFRTAAERKERKELIERIANRGRPWEVRHKKAAAKRKKHAKLMKKRAKR